MPWKQWAYLEKVSSADFQTYLQNQTVPVFTTTAQRDTIYTPVPPPKGALCITQDTLVTWLWNGTAWQPLGQGVPLGSAYTTADGTTTTTRTLGSAVNLTFATARTIRIDLMAALQSDTAAKAVRLDVRQDSIATGPLVVLHAGLAATLYAAGSSKIVAVTAGTHSYQLQLTAVTASQTATGVAGSGFAIYDAGI